jgi:hypothetical protein
VIIFSDDRDAAEKLVDKIERLKERQGVMKRANHLIRKADREGLADLGFSEETIAKLFAQDFAGRAGFPNYALANNSANIRRAYSHVALCACPGGPDNHPGAYFWRLTNGKVPKKFQVEDTKWWLLELIPIQPKEGK